MQERIMMRLSLIGVSTLSFALAVPAMAQDPHHVRSHDRKVVVAVEPELPVENALRWGYSQGYSNYPSGFGGLYGDGRYPDNTVSNPNAYNNLH
jgi:hypothetical protein